MKRLILGIIIVSLLIAPAAANNYYQIHNLTGNAGWAGDQTNYPIYFDVYSGSGTSSGSNTYLNSHASNYPYDITFTSSDGTTELSSWPETGTGNATYNRFWVNATTILKTGNTSIYVYYGNATKVSPGYGSISTVFPFADDFGTWNNRQTVVSGGNNNNSYEPTVLINESSPKILTEYSTANKMWYNQGFGPWATNGISYAEAPPGNLTNWTVYNSTIRGGTADILPNMTNKARNSVYKNGSVYYMCAGYQDTRIDFYNSTDGINWTWISTPINKGSAGAWDDGSVANTNIWFENNEWRMLYDGCRSGGAWKVGFANSTDGGITWVKSVSNPVITETGTVGGPSNFYKSGSTYYFWMIHSATSTLPTDISRYYTTTPWANSTAWTKSTTQNNFVRAAADEVGVSGQVADPYLIENGGKTYLFYCASTDGASAAGNTHIKIAVYNNTTADLVTTTEDALNTIKWNPTLLAYSSGTGTYTIANSVLTLTTTSGTTSGISLVSASALSGSTLNIRYRFASRTRNGGDGQTRVVYDDSTTAAAGVNGVFGAWATNTEYFYNGGGVGDPTYANTFTTTTPEVWEFNGRIANPTAQKNNSVIMTGSGTPSAFRGNYIRLWEYAQVTWNMDWILARPYVSPEPAHGDWQAEQEIVTTVAPIASFTRNWSGSLPITRWIGFTDTSTNTPTSYQWSFGDGPDNSTEASPAHHYTKRGLFTVMLTATNSAGSSSNTTVVRVV